MTSREEQLENMVEYLQAANNTLSLRDRLKARRIKFLLDEIDCLHEELGAQRPLRERHVQDTAAPTADIPQVAADGSYH